MTRIAAALAAWGALSFVLGVAVGKLLARRDRD